MAKKKVPAPELSNLSPAFLFVAVLALSYVFMRSVTGLLVIVAPVLVATLGNSPWWKSMSAPFHWAVSAGSCLIILGSGAFHFVFVRK